MDGVFKLMGVAAVVLQALTAGGEGISVHARIFS